MKKSCNSDFIEFACLTNSNIENYLSIVPMDVEEITFWNYVMCLHPRYLETKEPLTIPSLNRFRNLISVRIYNERLSYFPDVPLQTKIIMFISTVVENRWYNICFSNNCYADCMMKRNYYSVPSNSSSTSAIGLFNSLAPYVSKYPKDEIKENPIKPVDRIPFYKRFFNSISEYYASLFSKSSKRVYPKEIELTSITAIERLENRCKYSGEYQWHSLESINRLKKNI